jgi:DNA mismatch endonuclease (patch repair protein)
MADVFSVSKRSEVMAQIRARGNKATELEFARLLRVYNVTGWRRHVAVTLHIPKKGAASTSKRSRVRPDFVFPKYKIAIFVDGCFWHGCADHCTPPASNVEFWRTKLAQNRKRDRWATKALRNMNWQVLRIWEHQLKNDRRVMIKVMRALAESSSVR